MVNRDHRFVATVRKRDQLDARRQRQVRQTTDVVDFHRRQIDLQKFRQILRQAQHFDVVQQVRHDAALRLDARRTSRAPEVQRDGHADLLVLQHALQIHVQDLVLGRMTLHVFQDGSLRLAIDLQLQDGGEELFVHQQGEQVLVIQNELLGFLMATVEDRRNFPGTTQAAARTLPCSLGRESATRSNEYFMVTPVTRLSDGVSRPITPPL